MSYFVYNGTSSEELGLKIKSKNVYSSPKYDATMTTIPGRNGELIISNNRFPNATISYSCFLPAKSIEELERKIRNVKKWLYAEPDRYHELTDSFDSLFFRKAVFNSKLDITDEVSKIGIFTITFSCYPFRYSLDGEELIALTSSLTIYNPYPFASKPYIKIYGTGNGSFSINSSSISRSWTINNIDGYIECDSELMDFYKGSVLKNSKVVGDEFPELLSGNNTISFSGGITKIEIIPRWVCL